MTTSLIKSPDSMIDKIFKKCVNEAESYPINKVLNDLLGFRVIDNNFANNIEHLNTYIDTLKQQKLRIRSYYRQNTNYEGYHIYFMGTNNRAFPIELQIWDSNLEKDNLLSHTQYKQGYLSDPNNYNKF